VSFQTISCEICGGQSGTGTGFSQSTASFPLSVSFHHCSILIHLHVAAFTRKKRAKPGNPPKINALSKIGEYWLESASTILSLKV